MHGNAQVGEYAIDLWYIVVIEPMGDEGKIGRDEREPVVVDDVLLGIFVLVKSEEFAVLGEMLEDGTGVPAAAEGGIYINTVGLNVEVLYAFI